MEWDKIIGVAGGVIGLVTTVVVMTRAFVKREERIERDKVERERDDLKARLEREMRDADDRRERDIRDLQTRLADAESRRDHLLDQLLVAGRAGGAILSRKAALDTHLQSLMSAMAASGASLYVPIRNHRDEVQGLAFLSIEPFNRQNQQLKSKIIPLRSIAGSAFTRAAREVIVAPAQNPEHFEKAEKIADYKPSTMLNLTLNSRGEPVGVVQLLRQEGEAAFETDDITRVAAMWDPMADQVGEITRNPEYLTALGVAGRGEGTVGTVLYFDLSNSTILFKELSADIALQTLNEYFETMCGAAFAHGATIDNYMGDGALLRFNVPRPLVDHEAAAVDAALDMRAAFSKLRQEWIRTHPQLSDLHHRVGIATGSLVQANLGHSQAQRPTLLGYPISVASALCAAGPRTGSPILIGKETYQAVAPRVTGAAFDLAAHPKLASLTTAAYEVTGLR